MRARFPLPTRAAPAISATQVSPLTNRERDVLRLVIDGLTNRAIAEQLSVSTETIKSHVHHIMQKMNAKDRTHAAVLATRQHWV
jgi:DNA-binding NarL/FixJ family response regulator